MLDEFGVYIDLNTIDLRHFIYLSDKTAQERKDRAQRQAAGAKIVKPRIKLKMR